MLLLAFLSQAIGLSKTNMVPYDGHDCSLTCVKGGKDLHSASLAKSWLCKQNHKLEEREDVLRWLS